MHFFYFLNIFLDAKLSEWRLFWAQNENGRGRLDFCATTSFFSKINVTFLDVWMILIELFDISVSFQFQNFPRTNFSRYGGLYDLLHIEKSISHLIKDNFEGIWIDPISFLWKKNHKIVEFLSYKLLQYFNRKKYFI